MSQSSRSIGFPVDRSISAYSVSQQNTVERAQELLDHSSSSRHRVAGRFLGSILMRSRTMKRLWIRRVCVLQIQSRVWTEKSSVLHSSTASSESLDHKNQSTSRSSHA